MILESRESLFQALFCVKLDLTKFTKVGTMIENNLAEIIVDSQQLITNSEDTNMYEELLSSLNDCDSFFFSVAFINYSGLQLLLRAFSDLKNRDINGKIITTNYMNFTEPKALRKLCEYENIETKVFLTNQEFGFHSKAYIFEYPTHYKIIIGSSNITQRALKNNVEWNVKLISKREHPFSKQVIEEFKLLWERTNEITDLFLDEYEEFIKGLREVEFKEQEIFYHEKTITPNSMQIKAIQNLQWLRDHGEEKALIVAATATGKTYLSAFDVQQFQPKRMLFIVHREDILIQAELSFKKVLGAKIETGLFTGSRKDLKQKYIFATIQTMNNHFSEFKENEFDYIVVDEAHHATSPSYRTVLDYFKPQFLLGMTATPERSDGDNLFSFFNNNVALEVRLYEAMESNLVIPFHYFGITDVDGIDLSTVDPNDMQEITKRLSVNRRVDYVVEKMNFYGHDGDKLKCLGFCATVEHAQFMADMFNKNGIKSECISGTTTVSMRKNVIEKLESDEDELNVIFTVDVFNEGVDIPSVNLVLMLRPTNSAIIFIQQLGRGLRKYKNKEYLTVLDFIGNYNRAFLIAIALKGSRFYDKDSLKVAVATDFRDIPGNTFVQMDAISKQRILKQLENENFNTLKYLREEFSQYRIQLGKTPKYLVDYETFEGSPDPLKFVEYAGSYYEFLCKMTDDQKFKKELLDESFIKIIHQLSNILPAKRIHELVLLDLIVKRGRISKIEYYDVMKKHIENVDIDTCNHAIECIELKYLDTSQLTRSIRLIDVKDDLLSISEEFNIHCQIKTQFDFIDDTIQYGIIRYNREFGVKDYGFPAFKLYYQYKQIDAAYLSNYRKKHTSFSRGNGLLQNGNDFFLFVNLHKDEDVKERINYNDVLLDRSNFQWQTPYNVTPELERGKNLTHNVDRGFNLHLFIRKFEKIDNKPQPYIYLGRVNSSSFNGSKPITIQLILENEIPFSLYYELKNKVIIREGKN